jgi:2,3-dihydro-2,3-dihydroxybenzoate dehydrogenase
VASMSVSESGFGGRVAVVTGAASGIGRTVCELLLAQGSIVVGVDLRTTEVRAGAERTLGLHSQVTDVTVPGAVEELVRHVEGTVGPIYYLVNAAGILSRPGPLVCCEVAELSAVLATNVGGLFSVTQRVAERMVERRVGSIVTVSSNAGEIPRVGLGPYCASKAAATMLTKCFALELAPAGVRCNVVSPGSTDTPMLRALLGERSHAEVISGDSTAFRLGIPLGKIATPLDVAHAVVFLLSEEAGHITGHDLRIDGGATP